MWLKEIIYLSHVALAFFSPPTSFVLLQLLLFSSVAFIFSILVNTFPLDFGGICKHFVGGPCCKIFERIVVFGKSAGCGGSHIFTKACFSLES